MVDFAFSKVIYGGFSPTIVIFVELECQSLRQSQTPQRIKTSYFFFAIMKKLLAFLSFTLLMAPLAKAQQDPQFTQYMFNKLYFNPAYAGIDAEFGELTLLHRSQWVGYTSTFNDGVAPTTQSLSFSMPFPRKESFEGNPTGFGINVINDEIGFTFNQQAHLSLAHHIRLKRGQLSFGIRGGVYVQGFKPEYRPVDPDDPVIPTERQSDLVPDVAVGVYYNTVKYFVGLSFNHLLGSEFNFEDAQTLQDVVPSKLVAHGNLMFGYNWDVSPRLVISPMGLVKWAAPNNISFEFSTIGTYDEKFYLGMAYRQESAASILTGIYLMPKRQLRLGYAFDLVVQGQDAKSTTSHEIRLTYRVPPMIKKLPSIIRTPRFNRF